MAISQKRYIDITSGVGGGAAASNRELIARCFTTSEFAPFGSVMEFTSLDNVGLQFGTESDEYAFASDYFGFVSKNITAPKKISFARWAKSNIRNGLFGGTPAPLKMFSTVDLSTEFVINGQKIIVTINPTPGISYTSYTELGDSITAAINDASSTALGVECVYQSNGTFQLFASGDGDNYLPVDFCVDGETAGTSTLGSLLGFTANTAGAFVQEAVAAETAVAACTRVMDISNNCGSFCFLGDVLSQEEIENVAEWNNTQNVSYMYSVAVNNTDYAEIQSLVDGMDGTCLTLGAGNEYMPMTVLAATDYTRANATQNFMFQQFPGATPTVTTDQMADTMDALKINYYGATQSAGVQLAFYQRGVLQGATEDIGVYCNEMWLKDALLVNLMNLLIAVPKVPANERGKGMCLSVMQEIFDLALLNGTFSPAKELTAVQKVYISTVTGDPDAWRTVYDKGYWIKLDISTGTVVTGGSTDYILNYTLVYSKGDAIKKVVGSDILI